MTAQLSSAQASDGVSDALLPKVGDSKYQEKENQSHEPE